MRHFYEALETTQPAPEKTAQKEAPADYITTQDLKDTIAAMQESFKDQLTKEREAFRSEILETMKQPASDPAESEVDENASKADLSDS